jgi:succinoglycan biosynthesis transport protein ExoP
LVTNDVAGVLGRRWRLVLTGAVLGVLAALFLSLTVTPAYSAHTKLFVAPSGDSPGDRLQNAEYTTKRITSYVSLVDSPAVLDGLRTALSLRAGDHITDGISASSPLDSAIIDVTVQDSSPARAQEVARAIGGVLNTVVTTLETAEQGGGSPVRISAVNEPARPTAADSPNRELYALGGLVAGLALGAALALLREWRQRRAVSAADPSTGRPADGTPGADAARRGGDEKPRDSARV